MYPILLRYFREAVLACLEWLKEQNRSVRYQTPRIPLRLLQHNFGPDINRGSSFEDFLKEEGILDASNAAAVKKVLARQIAEAMRTQHITKSAMAARMHTSRSQLERPLDPEKTGISLETM